VFLDAATVAPPHPVARQVLLAALDEGWADPRRLHHEGRRARQLLDGAREAIAAVFGARTEEITFTASHTAAVHAGILGVLRARRRVGTRVVTSAVEHSAVLQASSFDQAEPVRVTVDHDGVLNLPAFGAAVSAPGTALACLQSANGELGTLQPVAEAAALSAPVHVPLLVDHATAAGHSPTPPGWQLLTADPRSWGGPGGLGVLAIRAGTPWLSPAPEHEGTEQLPGDVPVPQALAAAACLQAVSAEQEHLDEVRRELVDRIRHAIAAIPDTEVFGPVHARLPHVATFSCLYLDGETLVRELDALGFAVGSGSACTTAAGEPSHVLAAIGALTHGNVRIGLPTQVDPAGVNAFCAALPGLVRRIREQLGVDEL